MMTLRAAASRAARTRDFARSYPRKAGWRGLSPEVYSFTCWAAKPMSACASPAGFSICSA
jgi:hypothetical protein